MVFGLVNPRILAVEDDDELDFSVEDTLWVSEVEDMAGVGSAFDAWVGGCII
jgi:hypothetical protein